MPPVDQGEIANTDKELMADGLTGTDELEFDNTDRSLEEMGDGPEGDHLPDEEAEEVAEAAAPEGDDPKKPAEPGQPDDKPADEPEEAEEPEEEPRDIRGYRAEMLKERKARQAAEATYKAAREEIAAERARIDRILAERQQYPQQPQQAPPPPPMPDPVLDPQGYQAYVVQQVTNQMLVQRAEHSFAEAYEEHGKAFEEAYVALNRLDRRNPVDYATGNRIINSPNPAKALMRWHREQTFLRDVGGDPTAYEAKMREKLVRDPDMVKAVLASLREQREGGTQGSPRNITRLPPSLGRARGGTSSNETLSAYDNTDQALFDHAMNGNG